MKYQKKGILEDTVIAIVGDHYPYDISINNINISDEEVKDDFLEHGHLIRLLVNNMVL